MNTKALKAGAKFVGGAVVKEVIKDVGSVVTKKETGEADTSNKMKIQVFSQAIKYVGGQPFTKTVKTFCKAATVCGSSLAGAETGAAVGTGLGFMIAGPIGAPIGYVIGTTSGIVTGVVGGYKVSTIIDDKVFNKNDEAASAEITEEAKPQSEDAVTETYTGISGENAQGQNKVKPFEMAV